jgi:hypothetical protein
MAELDLTSIAAGSIATPAAGVVAAYADSTGKRLFQKDEFGLALPLVSPHRVNVLDYGAKGDGSTNDSTAIQNAINAAGAMGVSGRGVDVFFPAGVYSLGTASPITCNFNNVMLVGEGWQSTILYYTVGTTGDVLQIGNGASKSGCGLIGLSVWKSAAGTTGSNININAMNDCLVRDCVVNNGFNGITIQGASIKVWIDHVEVNNAGVTTGVGIQVTNGAAGDTYITDCVMSNNPANKPAAGIQLTQTGHCSILRCNITSCVKGLHVNPSTSQDVSYLFIDHTLFDSCGSHGAHFNGTTAATSRIRSVVCCDSWFSGTTAAGSGIEFTASGGAIVDGFSFLGCRILNNFNAGVTINAGPTNISFTDSEICGNGTQTINTSDGISIAANASGISLLNNKIGQAGTAANQQRYAISVAAGTGAGLVFVGNDCQPNGTVGTNGYINLGAVTGGGNIMDNNLPTTGIARGDSRVAATAAITTTDTLLSVATAFFNRFMANGWRAGQTARFVVWGAATVTTAPSTWQMRARWGTANSTADAAIADSGAVTSGAVGSSNFRAVFEVTCRTVGASGTFHGTLSLVTSSATLGLLPINATTIVPTFTAGNTTTSNYLNLSLVGSANVSITVQGCTMEMVTP